MKREWLLIFAGPTLWFLHLLVNFALAPWACSLGWKPALHVSSLIFLPEAAQLTAIKETRSPRGPRATPFARGSSTGLPSTMNRY